MDGRGLWWKERERGGKSTHPTRPFNLHRSNPLPQHPPHARPTQTQQNQASRDVKLSWKIFEGIYDGVGPGLAASAPACAAFFGAYDTLRRTLSERFPDPKCAVLVNMAAAAGGDLTQSVVRVPFEVVKQRMQAGVEKTWREAVSNILASSGPKGFFAGWGALALRDLPFDLIEFPLYEALKELWAERKVQQSVRDGGWGEFA